MTKKEGIIDEAKKILRSEGGAFNESRVVTVIEEGIPEGAVIMSQPGGIVVTREGGRAVGRIDGRVVKEFTLIGEFAKKALIMYALSQAREGTQMGQW